MKIPKKVKNNNRIYEFVKKYPKHLLYEDIETKTRTSFKPSDLGLIKEIIKPPKADLKVEKVKL